MTVTTAAGDHDASILADRAPTLAHLLRRRIELTPDSEAFRYPEADGWASLSWAETGRWVSELAAGLISLGVGPQDRVAIASSTRIEWVLADLAVMLAGAATTTIYPTTGRSDVGYILADSEARVVFAENAEQVAKVAEHSGRLPALLAVVSFDDDDDDDDDDDADTGTDADGEVGGGADGSGDGSGTAVPHALGMAAVRTLGAQLLAARPDVLEEVLASLTSDDLATLIYTSGTTGRPKGVRLSHGALTYEAATVDSIGTLSDRDLQYLWLPLAHVFGKLLIALPLQIGFPTAVDGRVEKIVANLPVIRPTFMGAAPRIFEKVYAGVLAAAAAEGESKKRIFDWATAIGSAVAARKRAGQDVSPVLAVQHVLADRLVLRRIRARFGGRVRFFVSGSAALNPDVAAWFDGVGITILEGYGLTETSAASFCNRPGSNVIGSVGRPYPGTEVQLAEDGEILLRGPGLMQGYHNQPEATALAIDVDGWFHTGDIGTLDEQGVLRITDRKKDLFKTSGGKYVAPSIIESTFKGICPLASQLIVCGSDRRFVAALITLDPDAVGQWAQRSGMAGHPYSEVVGSAEMRAVIQAYVDTLNEQLNPWEAIRRFAILERDLTVEAGELTPSLKLRRSVVAEKYADVVESLYS